MIPLIPYRRFELATSLEPGTVATRVAGNLSARRSFWDRITGHGRGFEGEVTSERFRFSRIIGYRNSFLPVVRGHIRPDTGGSRVDVTMTIHPAVMLFLVFWGVGFGAGAVAALVATLQGGTTGDLVVVAVVPIAYVVITLAFGIEALKAERFIRAMLPPRPPK